MPRSLDLDEIADPTVLAVESVQNIDPQSIARTEALGRNLDLSDAVPAFRRLGEFFRLIPVRELAELPEHQKETIKKQALEIFQIYQAMMSFNPASTANAAGERESLINQANGTYATAFEQLHPIVSYLGSKARDVSAIEREARAAAESAKTSVADALASLQNTSGEAQRILAEVRRTAAESGVSQQASYFENQATKEAADAATWQRRTYVTAVILGLFALATWVLGFFIEPKNAYQAVQFGISKVLIFSTIAFLLLLSSRTLMAHRHNETVNRHRQNALLTFNALADAATSEQTREVVLTHASACIYAPQESGFTKAGAVQTPPSLIDLVPRIVGSSPHAPS